MDDEKNEVKVDGGNAQKADTQQKKAPSTDASFSACIATALVVAIGLLVWAGLTNQNLTIAGLPPQQIARGNQASDFTAQTISGKTIKLSDFRDKTVLIYFWCLCPMHGRQVIYVQNLYDMQTDIVPIVVTDDIYGNMKESVSDYHLTVDIIKDSDNQIIHLYGITSVPDAILIAPDGSIRNIIRGSVETQGEFLGLLGIKYVEDNQYDVNEMSPMSISNVQVVNIRTGSADMRWDTNRMATSQVQVFADSDHKKCISKFEDSSLATKHLIHLSNLTPQSTARYNLCVIKSMDANSRETQCELDFLTQPDNYGSAPKIFDVRISSITDDSAVLSWSTSQYAACFVSNISEHSSYVMHTEGRSHTLPLTGLKPAKAYALQINARGTSAQSVSNVFTLRTLNQGTGKVIFEDDFNDKESGWVTYSNPEAQCEYSRGGLSIRFKKAYWCHSWNSALPELGDFAVETDVKWLTRAPAVPEYYGLDYEESGTNYYYRYIVDTSNGTYMISKLYMDEWYNLRKGTLSPAINKYSEINRMKIARQGAKIEFYINGTLLTTMTDYSFTRGSIKLLVGTFKTEDTYVEALFDNVIVSVP